MKIARPVLVWSAGLALSLLGSLPARPQTDSGTPAKDARSCDEITASTSTGGPTMRLEAARAALGRPCRPMPAPIWAAIGKGSWGDGKVIDAGDRAGLLAIAVRSRYPEAETLAVRLLEDGQWVGGSPIHLEEGATVIRSLKPALTPYRVHLLMDIFEQIEEPFVRSAVLETLSGSAVPEALLPAIQAYYEGRDQVQQAGLACIRAHVQDEKKTPQDVLVELAGTLPEGPFLEWARRLGQAHSSPELQKVLETRAPKGTPPERKAGSAR